MNRTLKAIAAITLMMVFALGCTKPDEPNNGGNNSGQNDSIVEPNNGGENDSIIDNSGTLNGHDYVDLGLPSGTLWANCNVETNTPEGYGDYYAWGETQPKATYNWDNYIWSNGTGRQLTKYCSKAEYGYYGFSDNLTNLLPSDDAATAKWGYGWRTPTAEEWDELSQNTSRNWIIQNGVDGLLFTANNGNSIFLPAAGYRLNDDLFDLGGYGGYWSSSLSISYPLDALDFCFGSGLYENILDRRNGRSIRAVHSTE